jgi:hypothetical protein
MVTIRIMHPATGGQVLELPPGRYRVGRQADNDVVIDAESVSGHHCELGVEGGRLSVRDLGSTNGTFVNRRAVEEAMVEPGQTLQLGRVQVIHEIPRAPSLPAAARMPRPGTESRGARPPNRVVEVLGYPFWGNGWVMLLGGAILFSVLDLVQRWAGLLSLFVTVIAGGYLFAFLKSIIVASAQGEDRIPPWPDLGDWRTDILHPYLQAFVVLAVCFAPAALASAWIGFGAGPDDPGPLGLAPIVLLLNLAGAIYCPMAFLAVAMADSLSGLNPFVVIPAIRKVPGAYAVTCAVLLAMVGVQALADALVGPLAWMPILPAFLLSGIALYLFILEARLLGLLYFRNREKLGWF